MSDNTLALHARCPWCGSVPIYREDGRLSQHPELYHLWSVGCPNLQCPVYPWTRGFHEKYAALDAWDRRYVLLEELRKREAGVA